MISLNYKTGFSILLLGYSFILKFLYLFLSLLSHIWYAFSSNLVIKYIEYIGNILITICYYLFLFFSFLGPHLWHMEVPRLGVESELQLPGSAKAIAMCDSSRGCDLYHSSLQHWIPNPQSTARNRTCILMDTTQLHFHSATMGIPFLPFLSTC